MGDQKRTKKTIWIYAVVLFTSAFIVLLLTAYSQIKFNKNINDYRTELSSKQKESLNFQMNLNAALEENNKIKVEIEDLKKSITEQDNIKENLKKELESTKSEREKVLNAYETLISAEKQYDKGNIVESAKILFNQCDSTLLQKEALERYNELLQKTVEKASYKLYTDGYKNFRNKKYSEAIENLLLSLKFSPDSYYSDDCLYYAAYSQYKLGNKEEAKNTAKILSDKYPKSIYLKELDVLLNQ